MISHQVNLNLADFIHLKPQCSSDHELVGHDHGSENNAADWDGYDDTTSRKTRFQPI